MRRKRGKTPITDLNQFRQKKRIKTGQDTFADDLESGRLFEEVGIASPEEFKANNPKESDKPRID